MKLLSYHSVMRLKFLSEIPIFQMNQQQIRMWHTIAKEKHLKPVKTKLNHYKDKKNPWISMDVINSIRFIETKCANISD